MDENGEELLGSGNRKIVQLNPLVLNHLGGGMHCLIQTQPFIRGPGSSVVFSVGSSAGREGALELEIEAGEKKKRVCPVGHTRLDTTVGV